MAKGSGKPCGASHIAQNRVCRVNMPSAVAKALDAVSGEVGARTLKEAVGKHAGPQGVARLREIRADIRNEMGGKIVKGPKADELKKRLQAEGLLPSGKPKSVAPEEKPIAQWAPKQRDRSIPPELKKRLADLAAQAKPKAEPQEWKPAFLAKKESDKPDALWGDWDTDRLQKMQRFFKNKETGPKRDEQLARIEKELARRERLAKEPPKATRGQTEKEMSDLSRIMRGEEPKHMAIVSAPGELGMGARAKSKSQIAQLQSVLGLGTQTRKEIGRDLEGLVGEARNLRRRLEGQINNLKPGAKRNKLIDQVEKIDKALDAKTQASESTKYAREDARTFDGKMAREQLRREGDKTFDKWDETTGKGAKKLGSGAYGTVITPQDKSYAVKRGDISDTEARLIQKLGDRDLGPKLIAADVDGPGMVSNPGVNVRQGRLAMTVVPGSPIGRKQPDTEIGGVKVADAYWTARANLHRMGIAHNDMHIDNVLIDGKGKGRFVDMGLAQDMPKAALAEAMGAFEKPRGAMVTRASGVQGQGDWQVRRWDGTAGRLLSAAQKDGPGRRELERRAPVAARVLDNKNALQFQMQKDGYSKDDIATVMDHGLRNSPDTYTKGVWSRMTDEQAMNYINILYDGV